MTSNSFRAKRSGSPRGIRRSEIPAANPRLQNHESLPALTGSDRSAPAETSPRTARLSPHTRPCCGEGRDRTLTGPAATWHPAAGPAPCPPRSSRFRRFPTPERARPRERREGPRPGPLPGSAARPPAGPALTSGRGWGSTPHSTGSGRARRPARPRRRRH